MYDFLVRNGGIIPQSLEMFFVGRLKKLLPLRDLAHLMRRSAIL
jgi:hypothetical protein